MENNRAQEQEHGGAPAHLSNNSQRSNDQDIAASNNADQRPQVAAPNPPSRNASGQIIDQQDQRP